MLLDLGNLVLRGGGNLTWQSFDYSSGTYLLGMKLGWFGLTTDQPRIQVLSSRVGLLSALRGAFTLGVPYNAPNMSVYRGDSAHVDIGFWEGKQVKFIFKNSISSLNFSYVSYENEAYFTFNTIRNYTMSWLVLDSTGQLDEYTLYNQSISSVSHSMCEDPSKIFNATASCLNSTLSVCKEGDAFSVVSGLLPSSAIINGLIGWGFGDSSMNEATAAKLELSGDKNQEQPMFSFSTIETATNYFAIANMLGEGGFGPVYKGKLPQGQEIAVKWLSKNSWQGLMEFKNEITLISKLQHRNLIPRKGCCWVGESVLKSLKESLKGFSIFTSLELVERREKQGVDGLEAGEFLFSE
ncbi:probable LRR receptor-like serine/threonine-protein kinase MEE39 [Actinidia eriantha]|uniref:probable LRR receptor-like serine/threonine-protein kinase MEE39 n=1 Tax=Actinidia eriantha TaxID=165200 RepID=UPI002584C343|nr:probable LRR receptor-like serine/threonine-protein kinase MEE39 [Actinidia eriantha]